MCTITALAAILCLLMPVTLAQDEEVFPPGHLQPLGSHMPPIEIEIRSSVPDPIEFFDKYIKPGQPVVMKGAAKVFGNFETWRNDSYLRETYGNWLVPVEVGKYEGSVFGDGVDIPFRIFIDFYKKKNIYLITDIVADNPMRDEVSLLKSMACGGYAELTRSVMIFYSSAGTQSALHMDDYENMHCLFDGQKEWILFDRKIRDKIPRMENFTAYGAMDCRKVDMVKYPIIQELPWYHAYLEAGDCLFVPWGWPHHVKSYGNQRNMATAIWFGPVNKPVLTDCPENMEDLPSSVPLGRRVVNKFTKLRNEMLEYFEEGSNKIDKERFLEVNKEIMETKIDDDVIAEMMASFDVLDLNKDGFISMEELDDIPEDSDMLDNDIEIVEYHEHKKIEKRAKPDEL